METYLSDAQRKWLINEKVGTISNDEKIRGTLEEEHTVDGQAYLYEVLRGMPHSLSGIAETREALPKKTGFTTR